jgi:aminocarboxymuconate-semialdehyde decarboxylase
MPNRREFVKTAAALMAGMYFQPLATAQAPARRQVTIGNRRVRVVDVHGHFIIPEELEVVRGTPLEGNIANNLKGPQVLGAQRVKVLDDWGIDVQVLTHQGAWWYGMDRDSGARLIKIQNEGLAKACQQFPDRLVGFAAVSLQHPDLAAQQLEYAVKTLGLKGVGISGHANNEVPSSPKYDPFWAKVQELGVLVFTHPANATNIIKEGSVAGRGDLGNIIGNPLETTLFLSKMIFDGALDRFPRVKICGAHAGGFLASYIGRTDVTCEFRENANCANKKHPREYFKDQILVDSMIFSEEGLRHLVAEYGISQVVYGTDIPFNWPSQVDLIVKASFLKDAEKEAILSGNLLKLLKM